MWSNRALQRLGLAIPDGIYLTMLFVRDCNVSLIQCNDEINQNSWKCSEIDDLQMEEFGGCKLEVAVKFCMLSFHRREADAIWCTNAVSVLADILCDATESCKGTWLGSMCVRFRICCTFVLMTALYALYTLNPCPPFISACLTDR